MNFKALLKAFEKANKKANTLREVEAFVEFADSNGFISDLNRLDDENRLGLLYKASLKNKVNTLQNDRLEQLNQGLQPYTV